MQETWVWSPGREDPLEKGMATHSRILAWEIPQTEEPGGLQSVGLQTVGHDWATNTFTFFHWRGSLCHPASLFPREKPCRHVDVGSLTLMRITPWNSVLSLRDTCACLRMEHLFRTGCSGRGSWHLRVSPCPLPQDRLNVVNWSSSTSLLRSNQLWRSGLFWSPCSLPSGEVDSDDTLGSGCCEGPESVSFSLWPF